MDQVEDASSSIYQNCFVITDNLAKHLYQRYPHSYVAFVELEEQPERFLGRVIKNASGDVVMVDTLKDCVCVYIGSRRQTLFNYIISIAGKTLHNAVRYK